MTPSLESSVSAPWLSISRLIPSSGATSAHFFAVASQVARASPASAAALPSGPICAIVPISMLIWLARDPTASNFAFSSLKNAASGLVVSCARWPCWNSTSRTPYVSMSVLRQIHQRQRLIRIRVRVPRQLEHAPVIEGHDRDARELRRRYICRPASATAATASARTLARRRRLSSRRGRCLALRRNRVLPLRRRPPSR